MLFVHCKDTNLKAIHNMPRRSEINLTLFVHCKDTNLKAIHNSPSHPLWSSRLFVHCKDTNLKAIHNNLLNDNLAQAVVRALQRY